MYQFATGLCSFVTLLILTGITNNQYVNGLLTSNSIFDNKPEITSKSNNYGQLESMLDRLTMFSNQIRKEAKMVKANSENMMENTEFPLATPLGGESVRKDKLKQGTSHNVSWNELEKVERWRFKNVAGTNKHLKEIMIGKCWEYQNVFHLLKNKVDCDDLWEAFLAGFAYKEPCDVTLEDYNDFFNMIEEDPLVNKSMLWSGSRDITHELTYFNARFTALEDTFAGFLLDGLTWCGMKQEPGINYKTCPYECAKQKSFWGAAAKKMAERSEGVVYAVVNGTRQHWLDKQIFSAYMMDSYMARNQIPNLNADKVKEVRIMVGHSLHKKVLERCGTFSVRELQKQIEAKGIKATCIDDPLSVRALLCLDYPKDPLCQFHLTTLLDER